MCDGPEDGRPSMTDWLNYCILLPKAFIVCGSDVNRCNENLGDSKLNKLI